MSTLSAINLKHPSSGSNNIVLDSSGNATVAGNLTVVSTVTAASFVGNGSALTGIAGGFSNLQVFTSSGSWTVPAGITKAKVTVVGAGGGGGGATTASCNGIGGSAGGCAIKIVSGLTPGSTVAVTIGAAGTAGVGGGGGGTGGTSSFGAHCSATGGAGGAGNVNLGVDQLYGIGAIGVGGDINLYGPTRPASLDNLTTANYLANRGADGIFGLGFGGQLQTNQAGGIAAIGYNAGGGGGYRINTGGGGGAAGAPGIVFVEW